MNIFNWNSHEIEIGDFLARLMAAVWTRGNNWNQRPAKKKSIKTKMIVKRAITLFIRKRVYVRRRWKERKSSARWLTELVNVVKRLKTKLRVHKTRAICDRCGYFPSAKEKVFFRSEWMKADWSRRSRDWLFQWKIWQISFLLFGQQEALPFVSLQPQQQQAVHKASAAVKVHLPSSRPSAIRSAESDGQFHFFIEFVF